MNEKAAVTKELNDKHRKILEGLLKLPENKECADCKSKGPRWASVNLGIFVCMQCSGIHRSLGVHISKVRSATLDTWLPEQVAFMQTMGNVKANSYWEARLPHHYDRVGIENFIRAKYEDKRWAPLDKTVKPPSMTEEVKYSESQRIPDKNDESVNTVVTQQKQEKLVPQNTRKDNAFVPKLPRPGQASYESKVEPGRTTIDSQQFPEVVPASVNASTASPQNVVPPTDLFNMLSMEDSPTNVPESSPLDDDNWANFQSAEPSNPIEEATPSESVQSQNKTKSGAENLFNSPLDSVQSEKKSNSEVEDFFNSPSVLNKNGSKSGVEDLFNEFSSASTSQKPKTDVKNDILSLFEKSDMVSPFAVRQQQLAYIAQQQGLLMAAAKSSNGNPVLPAGRSSQDGSDNTPNGNLQAPNWGNFGGFQVPGILPSSGQQFNINQHLGSTHQAHPFGIYSSPTSGVQTLGSAELNHEKSYGDTIRAPAPTPASTPGQSLNEYDFSSLTQGLFSKH